LIKYPGDEDMPQDAPDPWKVLLPFATHILINEVDEPLMDGIRLFNRFFPTVVPTVQLMCEGVPWSGSHPIQWARVAEKHRRKP
jgi:hypothetical protein